MTFFRYCFSFILLLFTLQNNAQILRNQTFNNQIKTVQLHKLGWEHSYPYYELGSSENLVLSFDELSAESKNYNYSVVHCDANWEPSFLQEIDYINGFNQNPILNFDYSFNTTIDYIHYRVSFPNEEFTITKSGNYIIKVYEDFDVDHPVLTQRFMVVESRINILATTRFAANAEIRKYMQELHFTIAHPSMQIPDPLKEIKVNVFQNMREDNALINVKPQFIKKGEIEYQHNRELMFEGGNEYRWLDLRSIRFLNDKIRDVAFHDPYYHVELMPDAIQGEASYFFRSDFNGQYVISLQEQQRDANLESDYVLVHFSLPRKTSYPGSDVYVMGGLSNWQLNDDNKMTYNDITRCYEATLLLKQGFYNYQYGIKSKYQEKASVASAEGSYSQTENNYFIVVYYRGISDNYDRIIGVAEINTLKQIQ